MRIIARESLPENMSATRTVQNFGTLLKTKPHRLGSLVQLKPELSISMLTDALRNTYQNPKQGKSQFTPINSMMVEWQIDVQFIRKVEIAENCTDSGLGGQPIDLILKERYYDKHDSFALENRQQLLVKSVPKKLGTGRWKYTCTLIGSDSARAINTVYMTAGRMTRYRSNYHPELSERGYSKFMYNSETHRNFLSRHRASADWSGDYATIEKLFIAEGKAGDEKIYELNKKEKECLDNYLISRENHLVFGESNFDIAGKCQEQDEKGRDVPMGDGIIKQIERVADRFMFSELDIDLIEDAMQALAERSTKRIGNTWTLIVNDRFWNAFQKLMKADLRFHPTDGAYFYSKGVNGGKGGMVKVGASFNAYEFAGNTLVVMVDHALSLEYEEKAYALLLDANRDEESGRPNIALFTLEGRELLSGNLVGMGGASGTETNVDLATSVDGSSYHLLGYSGVCVFNPYRSLIMEQSVA